MYVISAAQTWLDRVLSSQRHPAHTVYPYRLRHLESTRSHHVWAADITYIPMTRGFVYLFAVLDWCFKNRGFIFLL